ncbi:MAG TPA: protein-methionine-sulfoxide reductase heme-binding subunit MsrQ [Pseudomonadales bacterium]|nr:protein-methionine-sulfoxide reductase heme-binding subunit MsrQ [Pseudomonadales bacterium]
MMAALFRHPAFKPIVFFLALSPLAWIAWQLFVVQSSPDPAKYLVDNSGYWGMRLLWLCLLMTPLRYLTNETGWIRIRRMLGLFAFFYACIHVVSYWFLLFAAQWARIWEELAKRPYVMLGMLAFTLLIPLAVTSTQAWQRRLKRNWRRLHQGIYLIAILVLMHFTWVKKLGLSATAFYAISLAIMLGIRMVYHLRHKPS